MEIKAELLGLEERKKRASELYSSIKKNYYLLEKICFIYVNDETSSLFQEEENENKTIDFITDINNENFTSLLEYITPKECPHYFHDNCLREKHLFYTKKNKNLCLFCKSYITAENMAKFGCITEDNLIAIVEAYNTNGKEDDHEHYSWRKTYKHYENYNFYDKIYDIFYSEVENNLNIRQIKRQKLIRIKKIKNKFKDNFDVLRFGEKKYDNYRQYDVSIYEDLDEIEEKLNNEIREKKEKLRKRNERLRIEEREERERKYLSGLCKLKTCSKCKKNAIIVTQK